jgi:hypothetical protein
MRVIKLRQPAVVRPSTALLRFVLRNGFPRFSHALSHDFVAGPVRRQAGFSREKGAGQSSGRRS